MIEPRHDRLVVTRVPEPPAVIHLTDAPASRRFKVIAVGPDVYDVSPGDTVLLPGIAAEQPDFADGKEALIQVGDIGCKIE